MMLSLNPKPSTSISFFAFLVLIFVVTYVLGNQLLDEQGFVILPRDMIGHGGVLYLPPVVTAISPLTVTYQKGGIITVLGTNFGTKTLFDDNGKYVGPLGRSTPVEEYMPPSVFVVKEGGAHVECERTVHVSSNMLICETPEMTSMNVSIVSNVVGQRSQAWVPGTVLTVESLPRYKYDCPVEKSGRCYDCCEAECQFQVSGTKVLALLVQKYLRHHNVMLCLFV